MFIGTYYHTIEEKGRVSLPKKFRDQGNDWIVTRGLDGGLFLFLKKTFAQELEKLEDQTLTKKAHRDFVRLMANEAQETEVDGNGRVYLPEYLRAAVQLTKDVVVIGSYNWVEIWDVTIYHQYITQVEKQAEEIAEKVT
jgi:MraZ protein